jgi:hypothetical protein
MLGFFRGPELQETVEVLKGFLDLAELEVRAPAAVIGLGGPGVQGDDLGAIGDRRRMSPAPFQPLSGGPPYFRRRPRE